MPPLSTKPPRANTGVANEGNRWDWGQKLLLTHSSLVPHVKVGWQAYGWNAKINSKKSGYCIRDLFCTKPTPNLLSWPLSRWFWENMHQQLYSQPVWLHMLNAKSGRHSPRTKFHLMLLVWFPRYVYVPILLPLIRFEPTDHFQANLTESAKRLSSHKLHDGFF